MGRSTMERIKKRKEKCFLGWATIWTIKLVLRYSYERRDMLSRVQIVWSCYKRLLEALTIRLEKALTLLV